MSLGANLKKAIENQGTNVNALADLAQVPRATIYSIIKRDNTKIDVDVLLKICHALGITTDELLNWDCQDKVDNANILVPPLTSHEIELIRAYRFQEENIRIAICKMIDVDYPVSEIQAKETG